MERKNLDFFILWSLPFRVAWVQCYKFPIWLIAIQLHYVKLIKINCGVVLFCIDMAPFKQLIQIIKENKFSLGINPWHWKKVRKLSLGSYSATAVVVMILLDQWYCRWQKFRKVITAMFSPAIENELRFIIDFHCKLLFLIYLNFKSH